MSKKAAILVSIMAMLQGCASVRTGIGEAQKVIRSPWCKVTLWMARCDDGVILTLRRYQNKNGPTRPGAVILCHGIGSNGNIFDLNGDRGLARRLAREGVDVWVPDLRGCGLSADYVFQIGESIRLRGCTIDDYIERDVPAILLTVRQVTGAKKIVWIGHNLGACIGLAYAAAHPEEQDMALIAIGASMTGQQPYPPILEDEAGACQRIILPTARFSALTPNLTPPVPRGWEALFYNPEHMPPETLEAFARQASGPISPQVARQFVAMLRGGELRSVDGKTNYAAQMSKVTCPVMFLCGKADNLADTSTMRRLYQSVASQEKEFRLFCLTNANDADFGNADLLIGPCAPKDVFPEVIRWVQKHLIK